LDASEGINVPVDVVGEPQRTCVLGLVQYAESIQDIVDWIENLGSAPAVLILHRDFGPDFMIQCKLSNSIVVLLMAQPKSYTQGTKTHLIAETMTEARTSLHEDHWFKQKVGEFSL